MAKTKISEFSTTAGNNTDINSINIAEGCAPSGINDAIRELMRQLKEFQTGGAGDSVNSGGDFSVATNKFTVASASGNTAVAGTLAVTGTTTLTGALVANGNATLGDTSGDTVTIKGTPTLEVNPTLSGGTANGVLYLNGSKVATSGSALTFDGTNFSATGTTTVNSANSSQVALVVKGETGNGIRQNFIGQASSGQYNWQIGASITAAGYFSIIPSTAADGTTFSSSAYSITPTGISTWYVGGTRTMDLTSTGLGIGTSSPAYKLDVNGIGRVGTSVNSNATAMILNNTNSAAGGVGVSIDAYSQNGSNKLGQIVFGGAGATGGNIDFQPSANGSTYSFAMRLDSSGNLGLGVTPSAWGSVFKGFQAGVYAAFSGDNNYGRVEILNNAYATASNAFKYIDSNGAGRYSMQLGLHAWYTAASGTAGDAISFTQAMTLDASGNLGVGTTSPTYPLTVQANSSTQGIRLIGRASDNIANVSFVANNGSTEYAFFNTGATYFAIGTNGSERARIDSSGNLLVGKTVTTFTTDGVWLQPAGTSWLSRTSDISLVLNRNGTDGQTAQFYKDGTQVGSISVTTTATAYNTSSDYRLKDNQQPLTGSGAFIDALKPKTWTWKADGSAGVGFIAHEVQEVSPSSVVGEKDGEQMQAMEYGSAEFIANIIAELQSLRKRLADAGIA